jgi:hypothetical protein
MHLSGMSFILSCSSGGWGHEPYLRANFLVRKTGVLPPNNGKRILDTP